MTIQPALRTSDACLASSSPTPQSRRIDWRSAWLFLFGLISLLGATAASEAASAKTNMLQVITREEGGVTHFFLRNQEATYMTATLSLQMENLNPSSNLPLTTSVPAGQTVEVLTLTPIDRDQPWNFNYVDNFTIGNINAVHDDSQLYSLPYRPGTSFRVTQGYHGVFSHTGPDEYAIDWKMPVGTPVLAARSGVVVRSKDDSDLGGPDRKYEACANVVLIEHSDGTIGIYAHLMKGGNQVKVGDHVKTGDLIAYSGNTGFTSGPHLHFSVFKAKSGHERLSLPVKFRTADEIGLTLVGGKNYKAAPMEVPQVQADAAPASDKKPTGS